MIQLSTLIQDEDNPRIITEKEKKKLRANLTELPKAMRLRPIVIRSWEDPRIIAGNQRAAGLVELGYTEIPEEWVKTAEDFTDEEIKQFQILDNTHAGSWDWSALSGWNMGDLIKWGVQVNSVKTVEDAVKNHTNANASYPLVPLFNEKHETIIITSENETDTAFIRNALGMGKTKSYKKNAIGETFVITSKQFIKAWQRLQQEQQK